LLSLESPKGVGDSTRESIHSGVVNGLVYEIDGFIDEYRAICSNFIIILTGGDTEFWLND
jgi:type III pantothenate kinase